MSKVIISDTSCLIALSRIDKLDILKGIFSNILTTPEVALEFGSPLPSWIIIRKVINNARMEDFKEQILKDANEF